MGTSLALGVAGGLRLYSGGLHHAFLDNRIASVGAFRGSRALGSC